MISTVCFDSLKRLDIFGTQVALNYKKDNIFKTQFGGVVTIGLIAILSLLFFNNVLTLFEKSKIKSTTSSKYSTNPGDIILNNNNFMIAVAYDQTNFIKRPMVNITFEKRHYQRLDNGTTIQSKIPIHLEPCTIDHYSNLPQNKVDWAEYFKKYDLSNYLCLKKNETFQVGGAWENEDFYHLKFTLKKCVNQTVPYGPWTPTCEQKSIIDSYVDEDSRVRFLFVNYLISPDKTTDYIQPYMDSIIFNVQPEKMYTTANVMLTDQKFTSDESILPIKDYREISLPSHINGDFKSQYAIGNFSNYCEIFFMKSYFDKVIKREFLKLDEIISYMGGFCQIFLLIAAIVVYTIELANRLYDFEVQDKQKQANHLALNKSNRQLSQQGSFRTMNSQSIINQQLSKQTTQEKEDKNNKQEVQKRKLSEKKIVTRADAGLIPLEQIKRMVLGSKSENQNDKKFKSNYEQNAAADKNITKNENDQQEINKEQLLEQQSPLPEKQYKNQNEMQITERNTEYNNSVPLTMRKLLSQESFEDKQNKIQHAKNNIIQKNPSLNKCQNIQSINSNDKQQFFNISELSSKQQTQPHERSINNFTITPQHCQNKIIQFDLNTQNNPHINLISLTQDNSPISDQKKGFHIEINNLNNDNNQNNTSFGQEKESPNDIHKNQAFEQRSILKGQTKKQNTINLIETKRFLENELKFLIQRDRSLSLSYQFFINKITCGKFYNTKEVKLISKAAEQVKDDLDIFMILDRLKEIEKFKNLLLSDEQQVLFNFFQKPLITVEDEKSQITPESLKVEVVQNQKNIQLLQRKSKKLHMNFKQIGTFSKVVSRLKGLIEDNTKSEQFSDYQKLYNCYEKLQLECEQNIETKTNQKLFELLGEEMNNIFEIARLMKEKQNEKQNNTINPLQKQLSIPQIKRAESLKHLDIISQKELFKPSQKSKFLIETQNNIEAQEIINEDQNNAFQKQIEKNEEMIKQNKIPEINFGDNDEVISIQED